MGKGKRREDKTVQPVMSAGAMIGKGVASLQGEELGRIEAVMIESRSGRAIYAVLSFGAWMGINDKLFPIPWNLLRFDQERRWFVLTLVRERLKTAPAFDRRDWPRMGDREWASEINGFYGEQPYWMAQTFDRRGALPGRRATDRQTETER